VIEEIRKLILRLAEEVSKGYLNRRETTGKKQKRKKKQLNNNNIVGEDK
jgi:hypothetical protein